MRVEIPNQITVTIGGLISRGVKAVEVTDAGRLVFTLTDGSTADIGSVMGPQGPKGETGATGPQGQTGPQGAKGDTGAAGASITSITKKSQSGTTATYTIALSDGKTFDFNVETVKGEKGDTGATGPQGETGPQGKTGPQGPAGPTGPKGDTGTGFTVKGYYGSVSALQASVKNPEVGDAYGVGAAAPYDIYIYDGVTKAWVNNGPLQGAKGDKGDPGEQGPKGEPGDTGQAGADGVTPTIGTNGNWYLGETDTGKPSRGEKGDKGDKGNPGAKGEPGETGPQGPTGPQGETGPQGPTGPAGDNGVPGANGVTPTIGTNGNWYLGETDTGKPSRGEKGDTGAAGTTFTPSVSADGTLSWTNDGGKTNPDSVNIKGPQGNPGEKGNPGETGAKGADGVTPTIGANGNWYLEDTDTGKPSRGEKGDKGDPGAQGPAGATPVKGTDYFTAEDKAALVQDVLAALPEWTGGNY